jgi:hypothetical protein
MSDPPVKTKRAGDLAATSPNCFELADHSAIVCSAQTWTALQEHALWMLASYSRTGNFKHLLAFARQVHGMRQRSLQ